MLNSGHEMNAIPDNPCTSGLARARRTLRVPAAASALFLAMVMSLSPADGAGSAVEPRVPTRLDLLAALSLAELTPASLAASGVPASAVPEIIHQFAGRLGSPQDSFSDLHAAYRAYRAVVDRLGPLVDGQRAAESERAAFAAARLNLEQTAAARAALLETARAAALASLAEAQVAALNRIRDTASIAVPTAYRAGAGHDPVADQDLWARLRDALDQQRSCGATGETLDTASQNAIEVLGTNPAIADAQANLAAHRPTTSAAWRAALAVYE